MAGKKKQKRRHFTPEYKAEVVALFRKSGKTAGEVSRDLGLTETSVRAWIGRRRSTRARERRVRRRQRSARSSRP